MVHYAPAQLDAVFGALADPTRRAVLLRLQGGERSVGDLAQPFVMSLTGFIKHLAILEDAGLIERRKDGRVVHCRLREGAMTEALDWLRRHELFWNARLDRLGGFLQRKETDPWKPQPKVQPASASGATTPSRSPRSTPRGRIRNR